MKQSSGSFHTIREDMFTLHRSPRCCVDTAQRAGTLGYILLLAGEWFGTEALTPRVMGRHAPCLPCSYSADALTPACPTRVCAGDSHANG
jgi:hypothetical protein